MTPEDLPAVEAADAADERRLLDTLLLAFGSDPLVRWLFPTPSAYVEGFPEFVRAYGGRAFDEGTAYHSPEGAGAALWLPPDVEPDEAAMAAAVGDTLSADQLDSAWSAFEQLEGFHPDEPHWRLPFVGVEPRRQGRGHGSALLATVLETCDESGTPVYLDSSNPRNLSLYLRHGFELCGTVQVGSMPPIFPMVREPRSEED